MGTSRVDSTQIWTSFPDSMRDLLFRRWHQRRHRNMRPGQASEVEEHKLGILDLGGVDSDRLGVGDLVRWQDRKSRYLRTGMGSRGLNLQVRLAGLEGWNLNRVLDGFDPECR